MGSPSAPLYQSTVAICSLGSSGKMLHGNLASNPKTTDKSSGSPWTSGRKEITLSYSTIGCSKLALFQKTTGKRIHYAEIHSPT